MDFKLYKRIVLEAVQLGLSKIIMVGDGEPTMHPEIVKFISYAKRKGLYIELYTNFLFSSCMFMQVIPKVDKVCFNVTGIQRKSFYLSHAKKKGVFSKFDIINRNINSINNQTFFKLIFTVTPFNYRDLSEVIELCLRKRIDIEIRLPVSIDNDAESVLFSKQEIVSLKKTALYLYNKLISLGELVFAYEVKKIITAKSKRHRDIEKYMLYYDYQVKRCLYLWGNCFVDVSGKMYACPIRRDLVIADLSGDSLINVWHSYSLYRLRKKFLVEFNVRKSFFKMCYNCVSMGSGEFYLDSIVLGSRSTADIAES